MYIAVPYPEDKIIKRKDFKSFTNYDYGKKEHIVRQHEIGLFNKYMKNEQ